jgi:hypothetical protein
MPVMCEIHASLTWRAAVWVVLTVLAAPAIAPAQTRWPDERQAGPFLCHADFALDRQQRLLAELADLQQDLTKVLGAHEPRETVHLFLFQDQPTYQAYLVRLSYLY